jgi:hypothetical protein
MALGALLIPAVQVLLGVSGQPPAALASASVSQDVTGQISSGLPGKCLDNTQGAAVNGNKVEIYDCDGHVGAQLWTVEADGTVRINGMCLDVKQNGTTDGTLVDLFTCNGGSNQQWQRSGSELIAVPSGKCLDDPHSSTKNGTQLDIWGCNGGSNQVWNLPSSTAATRAATAAAVLQLRYNNTPGSRSRGLFCTGRPTGNCWWQSADELNALINYSQQTGSKAFLGDIADTFAYAPREALISPGPFLDNYFDDDGWWGLTWLNAYELTGNSGYLTTAESILTAIKSNKVNSGTGWTACGGGVWQHTGSGATKDAIANEVYITLATRLYLDTGMKNQGYLTDAKQDWTWFQNAGNADHLKGSPTSMIESMAGLGALILPDVGKLKAGGCGVATTKVFLTLRQGQFLGALTDLYRATGTQAYLTEAESVANCVTSLTCGGDSTYASPPVLNPDGILTEPCGKNPYDCTVTGQDFLQYKGVFMEDLSCLNQVASSTAYSDFIQANASAVYTDDQNPETTDPATQNLNQFGFTWDRWSSAGINWATQGAALDALNASIGGSARMC